MLTTILETYGAAVDFHTFSAMYHDFFQTQYSQGSYLKMPQLTPITKQNHAEKSWPGFHPTALLPKTAWLPWQGQR
jgi:hypothetical protein